MFVGRICMRNSMHCHRWKLAYLSHARNMEERLFLPASQKLHLISCDYILCSNMMVGLLFRQALHRFHTVNKYFEVYIHTYMDMYICAAILKRRRRSTFVAFLTKFRHIYLPILILI